VTVSNCGVDVPEYADVEVSSSVMRYINLRFTYLLTYLMPKTVRLETDVKNKELEVEQAGAPLSHSWRRQCIHECTTEQTEVCLRTHTRTVEICPACMEARN